VPWFPDFANAAELARRSIRADGLADPVAQYLGALSDGSAGDLQTVWPGGVVVQDPRGGEVRGHHELRRFIKRSQRLLAERHAHVETVASFAVAGRAVVELRAYLDDDVVWPVAVVAESPDPMSIVFRTYCSQAQVDGRRHVRAPLLSPVTAGPADVVGRHLAALEAGDVEALVNTFAPDGYVREAVGAPAVHRGPEEIRSFYATQFGAGGGAGIHCCLVTDDGVRCAVEYNCDSWSHRAIPPQAGIAVYERGADGQLAAVRLYDDIEAPVGAA
jgi:ketosteroid isomerase-like protein